MIEPMNHSRSRPPLVTIVVLLVLAWAVYRVTVFGLQWIAYKNPETATLMLRFDEQTCREIFGDEAEATETSCKVRAKFAWEPSIDRRRWLVVFMADGEQITLPNPDRDLQGIAY